MDDTDLKQVIERAKEKYDELFLSISQDTANGLTQDWVDFAYGVYSKVPEFTRDGGVSSEEGTLLYAGANMIGQGIYSVVNWHPKWENMGRDGHLDVIVEDAEVVKSNYLQRVYKLK
jgi:hypothetical protein